MCGINGIVRRGADAPPIDREEVLRTREAMTARGPDDSGLWTSPDGLCALASRRLAILDLSPAGAQPMASSDGRYQLVQNGEIYNFRALRTALEEQGETFRSQSDTEVILALYAREGAAMLSRLRGMFALAIWDTLEKTLLLARDPLGIKPLYYAADEGSGGLLRFASQVKALEAGGAIPPALEPAAVAGFLLWGSVPEPWTIRRAVRALPAGSYLVVRCGAGGIGERGAAGTLGDRLEPRPIPLLAEAEIPDLEPAEALADSVRAHLVSDVPVAVFLSAGLDSGLLAALARRVSTDPLRTFTLGFEELAGTERDEMPLAAEVARTLGAEHVERRLGRSDLLALWAGALRAMDQPSIDGFNSYAVSRAAHEAGLKVVLSGLGGDELFGSYPSFTDIPRTMRWAGRMGRLPGFAHAWPRLALRLSPHVPKMTGLLRYGASLPGAYYLRRGLFLPEELPALIGRGAAEEGLAAYDPIADVERALAKDRVDRGGGGFASDPWTSVHVLETARYMRNQLLRDADWGSMAWSVELRVPLVDPWLRRQLARRGFEPARSQGKAALVRQVAPELPAAVFDRPKTGFYIPIASIAEGARPGAAPQSLGEQSRQIALQVLGAWTGTEAVAGFPLSARSPLARGGGSGDRERGTGGEGSGGSPA
jgi:asparagine synthase (glutamine-hydrolysing)